jgi:predicted GNAT family N-acyltransferase
MTVSHGPDDRKEQSLLIDKNWPVSIEVYLGSNECIKLNSILEISGVGILLEPEGSCKIFADAASVKVYFNNDFLGGRLVSSSIVHNVDEGAEKYIYLKYTDKDYGIRFSHRLVRKCGKGRFIPVDESDLIQIILALISKEEDISVTLAETPEEMEEIYAFRFKQYYELGKVTEEIFPGKRLVDRYDSCSTVLKASIHGHIVGTVRITFEWDVDEFELETDYKERIRDGVHRYAEISRFCIDKYFRGSFNSKSNLYVNLFSEVYRHCIRNKVEKVILSALKAHRPIYGKFGFETISDEFVMGKFKYSYFLMEADVHYSSVKDLYARQVFKKVHEEEMCACGENAKHKEFKRA